MNRYFKGINITPVFYLYLLYIYNGGMYVDVSKLELQLGY